MDLLEMGLLLNKLFTESRRQLERVAQEVTPADGVDVRWLVVDPLVEFVLPAVEVDEQQAADASLHGGHAHQTRLHQVHCLQLHVGGEAVTRVVLTKEKRWVHFNTYGLQVSNC